MLQMLMYMLEMPLRTRRLLSYKKSPENQFKRSHLIQAKMSCQRHLKWGPPLSCTGWMFILFEKFSCLPQHICFFHIDSVNVYATQINCEIWKFSCILLFQCTHHRLFWEILNKISFSYKIVVNNNSHFFFNLNLYNLPIEH